MRQENSLCQKKTFANYWNGVFDAVCAKIMWLNLTISWWLLWAPFYYFVTCMCCTCKFLRKRNISTSPWLFLPLLFRCCCYCCWSCSLRRGPPRQFLLSRQAWLPPHCRKRNGNNPKTKRNRKEINNKGENCKSRNESFQVSMFNRFFTNIKQMDVREGERG